MLTWSQQQARAEALVQDHFKRIDAMWRRNQNPTDLIGMLRIDRDGRWSLAMSGRQDKLEEAPELLRHLPQVARPAWAASPPLVRGTAMWLVVRPPSGIWTCLRVQRAFMASGGDA